LGESVYDREFSILLGEIDTRAHFNDAHVQATDWSDFHADFWTMNGRSYPDTLQPNGVRDVNGQLLVQTDGGIDGDGNSVLTTNPDPDAAGSRLLSNPLSSLVQAEVGERILIRLVNLGFQNHTIQFPGLEVDVLGRDARFVPDSAQRTKTDSVQIGPGESRDVFFKAPLTPGTYPFYNRGLSNYAGSADGTDDWVGGQRSEIRVYENLSSQLKPNGWSGEAPWAGEFPVVAQHAGLSVSAHVNRTTGNNGGRFISGTITTDTQSYLSDIWFVQATKDSPLSAAPLAGHASWNQVPFSGSGPYAFNVQVASSGRNSSNKHYYWVLAKDSAGVYSTPISVQI
jgi:FtsP/CotA-like multicopper oxidase with cupredoxin domain